MDENPINPNDAPDPEAPVEPNEPIVEPEAVEPEAAPASEPISIPVTEPEPEPEPVAEPVAEPEPVVEPTPASEPTPAPEPMMTGTPESMQPINQFPQKKKHTGVIIGIIIALLLIAAGVVICIILLNSKVEPAKPAENNQTTAQPEEASDEEEEEDEEGLSTVSCTMSGDTWSYSAEISIDNTALEVKKITYSMTLSDDYDPDNLPEDEQSELAMAGLSLAQYEQMAEENDVSVAGVTYTSEGEAGAAGWSGKVVVERDKVKNENILSTFDNLDGKTAKEYKDSASEDGLVCTIKK